MIQLDWKILLGAMAFVLTFSSAITAIIVNARQGRTRLPGCTKDFDCLYGKARDLDRALIEIKVSSHEHRENLERRLKELTEWLNGMDKKLDVLLLRNAMQTGQPRDRE